MYKTYLRENKPFAAILLFIILFGAIYIMKPRCFFNQDGSIREFGVGYRNKTILPIWLLSLVLGILCYLTVLYVTSAPRVYL